MGKNQEIVKDMWGTFIAKQPNKKDRVLVIDCPHHHLAHFCEEPKRHIPSISSSSSSSSSSSASSLPILPAARSTIDQEVSSILTTLKSGKRTASTANLSPRSDSSKSSKKTHSEEEPTESESDDDLSTTSLESELQPQPLAQKTSPPIADEYLKKFYPPGCSVRYARQEWTLHNWLEDGMISIRRESEERIINPVHVGLNLKKGDLFLVLAADKDGSFYYKAKLVTHADKKATFSLLPEETNETVVFSTNVGLLKRAIPLNDNANNILDEIGLEKQVESLYSDDPTQKIIGYDLTL